MFSVSKCLYVSRMLKNIYNQISPFAEFSKVIPMCQSGFRKHFSTSTTLLDILNDIRVNEEHNQATCMAMLNFNKAFDALNHELLLAKLKYFGYIR